MINKTINLTIFLSFLNKNSATNGILKIKKQSHIEECKLINSNDNIGSK